MNNIFKFSFYIFLTLAFAWLAFVVGAKNQYGDLEPTAESLEEDGSIAPDADLFPKAMSGLAQLGAKEYLSLGCATCHTQQVRSEEAGFDVERGWGKRPSVPRDYILQDEVLLGHNRVGPDLTNVGLREYSNEWLHQHLFMPQSIVEGSICQPSPFLYETFDESEENTIETTLDEQQIFIKPSLRANRIVAYFESLKQDYEHPEIAFSDSTDDAEEIVLEKKKAKTVLFMEKESKLDENQEMAIDTNITELDNLADENDKDSNEIEIEEASSNSEKRTRAKNNFGDQKYKFFTKEFDEVIFAEELESEEELFRLRQNLDQQLLQLKSFISKLANKLQRKLLAKQNRSWDFDLEEGMLDTSKLSRIIIDPLNS